MSNTKIRVRLKLLRKLNHYFKSQSWLVEDDFSLWSKGFIFNLKYKNIPITIGIVVFLVKDNIYDIEYDIVHRKTRR